MKLLMSIFKMTCKDVYPLISEEMDRPLSLGGKIRLKMHLAMCSLCGMYSQQLQVLRNLAQKLSKEDSEVIETASLKPETKEKLQNYNNKTFLKHRLIKYNLEETTLKNKVIFSLKLITLIILLVAVMLLYRKFY